MLGQHSCVMQTRFRDLRRTRRDENTLGILPPKSGRDERLYTRVQGGLGADTLKLVAGPPLPPTHSIPAQDVTAPPLPRRRELLFSSVEEITSPFLSFLLNISSYLPPRLIIPFFFFFLKHDLILTRQESSSCQPGQEPFLHLSRYLSGYAQNEDSPG